MNTLSPVFASAKRTVLGKLQAHVDYSPKGSIDVDALPIVSVLNALPDFITTSSCSGRIALYCYGGSPTSSNSTTASAKEEGKGGVEFKADENASSADSANESGATASSSCCSSGDTASMASNKGAGRWLLVTHGPSAVTLRDFEQSLARAWPGSSVVLKVEPFILHVQASAVATAASLMRVAMESGFRESGISVGSRGKIIVAVRSTASSLEVPLREGGRNIADSAYIEALVGISNDRFSEIASKRSRFLDNLKKSIASSSLQLSPSHVLRSASGVSEGVGVGGDCEVPQKGGEEASLAEIESETSEKNAGVECQSCGLRFPSRNRLHNDHFRLFRSCASSSRASNSNSSSSGGVSAITNTSDSATQEREREASLLNTIVPLALKETSAISLRQDHSGETRPPLAGDEVLCRTCGTVLPSRSKLFKHIRSSQSCLEASSLMSSSSSVPQPTSMTAARGLDDGGVLSHLVSGAKISEKDNAASTLANFTSLALLKSLKTSEVPSSDMASDAIGGTSLKDHAASLHWKISSFPEDTGALSHSLRYGHTSVVLRLDPVLSSAPPSSSSRPSNSGCISSIVATFAGSRGFEKHGRCNDLLLIAHSSDAAAEMTILPVAKIADASASSSAAVPEPRTRHAAVAWPGAASLFSARDSLESAASDSKGGGAACPTLPLRFSCSDSMLVFGGHNGPLHPLNDLWWLNVALDGATKAPAARVEWRRARIVNEAEGPCPRWGQTAVVVPLLSLPAEARGGSTGSGEGGKSPRISAAAYGVLVFGGRDSLQSFDDLYLLSLAPEHSASNSDNSSSSSSALRCEQEPQLVWKKLECAGAFAPSHRFYHVSTFLHVPLVSACSPSTAREDAEKSTSGGLQRVSSETRTLPYLFIHGGYFCPFLEGPVGGAHEFLRQGKGPGTSLSPALQILGDSWTLHLPSLTWLPLKICGSSANGSSPSSVISLLHRFSHSCIAVPARSGIPFPSVEHDVGSVYQPAEIIILSGGACLDPAENQGLRIDLTAFLEAPVECPNVCTASSSDPSLIHLVAAIRALEDNASYDHVYDSSLPSSHNGKVHPFVQPSILLPWQMRSSLVRLAPSSNNNKTDRLVAIGGGGVAFGFGSHFSALVSSPLPIGMLAEDSGVKSSDTASLLCLLQHAQHCKTALVQLGLFDFSRRPQRQDESTTNEAGTIATTQLRTLSKDRFLLLPILWSRTPLLMHLQDLLNGPEGDVARSHHLPSFLAHSGLSEKAGSSLEVLAEYGLSFVRDTPPPESAVLKELKQRSRLDVLRDAMMAYVKRVSHDGDNASASPPLGLKDGQQALLDFGALGGLPKKLEMVGDVCMLPKNSMTDPAWGDLRPSFEGGGGENPLWATFCKACGVSRLARTAEIDTGGTRASRVQLLHGLVNPHAYALPPPSSPSPPLLLPSSAATLVVPTPACEAGAEGGGDTSGSEAALKLATANLSRLDLHSGGWVRIVERGIRYNLDITRLMFSSGNVSEKARIGALKGVKGQICVDLFSGIGYFTLPLLLEAGAAFVHACDWNPDAIACLRMNLIDNRVDPKRYRIWEGDNTLLTSHASLLGTADRVLLGLIPSSEYAWPIAVALMRKTGDTWLHVHANKAEHEVEDWARGYLCQKIRQLATDRHAPPAGNAWHTQVVHIERVKSYAPRVWHVVVDIKCTLVTVNI